MRKTLIKIVLTCVSFMFACMTAGAQDIKEIPGFIELRSCRSQWVRGKTGDNTGV